MEELNKDDSPAIPPKDDDGEDEVVDNDEEDQGEPSLRRSGQVPVLSSKYLSLEYVQVLKSGEPETFDELKVHVSKVDWMRAIQDGMKSLHENHTHELVALPKRKRASKNKWVYTIKHE